MGMTEKDRHAAINDARARLGLPPVDENGRDPRAIAKLSHNERCEILAFALLGVPNTVIAAVFNVGTATITRIKGAGTGQTNGYAAVLDSLMSYNTNKEFCLAYITEKNEAAVRGIYPAYPGIH